ncbi:hypothetical protein GGD50_006673 [Rhizobium paranaense]|uniref:Uncharacterized protein n=1 Tax=Rhizobium paranaense TaxID=1650438 RepID=A0A7W8XYP0_9HYPH|nr:hypothetical protein [Rhizobium paranaense]
MFAIEGYGTGAIPFDIHPAFAVCVDGNAQTIRFAVGSMHLRHNPVIPIPLKCNDAPLALIGFTCRKCVGTNGTNNVVLRIIHIAVVT